MKRRKAFITGASGQDAAHLSKLLLEKGYTVTGGARRSAERMFWRLDKLGIKDKIKIVDFDLLDYHNMVEVIREGQFDEIYNLAAQSFVGTSFRQPFYSLKCNGIAVCEMVDIIHQFSSHSRFYQASSSEMFGEVRETPQSEWTPFNPSSPYGIAKLMAHNFVEMYREAYDFHGCCGILFNHEGELRGDEFVTKKITNYVADHTVTETLKLGNINAERDWGYAGDYVEAMWMMMQLDKPDTYVVGTGKKYTVRYLVEVAFKCIGIDIVWEGKGIDEKGINKETGDVLVEISEEFYRPYDVETLLADNRKIKAALKWQPKTSFEKMVKKMVEDRMK
jgi:GDPmannose 4,6-dehydratase